MPGVFTTAVNTETSSVQPTDTIRKKPKVITTRQMDENTSASSPLIDLTSRSPSPSPSSLPPAPAAPQQLSSYATCGQTRVVTTISTIHAPTPKLVELNSPLVSGNSVEPALTHPSSSSLPATTLTSIAPVASVAPSLTLLQSHQTKKLNASRGVDKPLPALVDYGGTTPGSSSASALCTDPLHVKNEPLPLKYSTQPPPTSDEGPSLHTITTDSSGMHNPSVILPTTAESSPTDPAPTSGNPSQVGVVTPQVGVVLSQSPDSEFPPLRLKCSVGDELDLEVDREEQEDEEDKEAEEMNRECIEEEEEEEEEDVDSVMELRIEEAGADSGGTEVEHGGHLNPSNHGKRTATSNTPENIEGEADDDSTESSSNQNSVGTSPPTSVGVRLHGHMEAADATRLAGEEPRSLDGSPQPSHNRIMRPMVSSAPHNRDVLPSYRVRKVTKVKQFFTTLQHFGNRQSSEVAEQVQELIAALVNGTATIEEFHQEIQTVTNHPLRQFIIPFLRENLDLFREELRDSEQVLSDILGHPPSSSLSATISPTPQIVDDDLPVLPSSKPTLTPTLSHTHTAHPVSSSLRLTAEAATHASSLLSTVPPVTVNATDVQRSASSQSYSGSTNTMNFEPSDADSPHFSPASRKRQRHSSADKTPMATDVQSTSSERSLSSVKRARHDPSHTPSSTADTVVISSATHRAPTYPYPPTLTPHQHTPTPSHSPHDSGLAHTPTPSQVLHSISGRKQLLSEDWAHVDMMLNSVVGMVDKVRHAVSMLRERTLNLNQDFEKKELEQEHIIQQRVAEATEKARRIWQEEKQHIQREASRKLKEAVAQVKVDVEQKIAQAQSVAVQETLKEANTQSHSKESCWNCGRRATETCSGCNKARYCGTFCQHKDWGNHMHQCASGLIGLTEERSSSTGSQHVIVQAGDSRMTSSDSRMTSSDEPPDIKPRISPEQIMSIPQINVRYSLT